MSQTAAGRMNTFRFVDPNPPPPPRDTLESSHLQKKHSITFAPHVNDPKYDNEPLRLYSLVAARYFRRRSYSDVKAGAGLNAGSGVCVGKGLLRELGLLRQGSQPEVLRVSNEQCSAPWDNKESRAVLKINKLLELSIACLYREITACHGPSVSLSALFHLFLCCGQLLLSHTGSLKIRKSGTYSKYQLCCA